MDIVLRSAEGKALKIPVTINYVEVMTDTDELAYLFTVNDKNHITVSKVGDESLEQHAHRYSLDVGKVVSV